VSFALALAMFLYDSAIAGTPGHDKNFQNDIARAVYYGENAILESPSLNACLLICTQPTFSLVEENPNARKPRYLRARYDAQDRRARSTADVLAELDSMHFIIAGDTLAAMELGDVLAVPWREDLYIAFQKGDGKWAKRVFSLTPQSHIDVLAFTRGYSYAGETTIRTVTRPIGEHLPLLDTTD
jgi:hypothetical protein